MRGLIGRNGGLDLNQALYEVRKFCLLYAIEEEDTIKAAEAKIQIIASGMYETEVKKKVLMDYSKLLFPYLKSEETAESNAEAFVKKYKQMLSEGRVDM